MNTITSLVLIFAMAISLVAGILPVKLTPEQMAEVGKFAMDCMAQEKVSKEAIDAFTKAEFHAADRNVKCYSNCFLEKIGVLVDGTLQPSVVTKRLTATLGEEKVKAILENCGSIKGADNCETAFLMFQCYHKEHADLA